MTIISLITDIPESIVPNTLIETDDNDGSSVIEFFNEDLSYEKSQGEQYAWKYATVDAFKDEYYSGDGFDCIFIEGYMTEEDAKVGHNRIVAEILAKGREAECLQ